MIVGCGISTPLADMDFETYSEAGYYFDPKPAKWRSITKSPPHSIGAVGASAYSEHPSTCVLCLAYNVRQPRIWLPGLPDPTDLFDHIRAGGIIEAWNSIFEFWIWKNVCTARMGWPELPYWQLRDAAAKARAYSLPGKLSNAAKAIHAPALKIDDGKRLINKFSKPRNPTKRDPRLRLDPLDDPLDAIRLYSYCFGDIKAESAVSALTPDLRPEELDTWLLDQTINVRGVHIDKAALDGCVAVMDAIEARLVAELGPLTGGLVSGVNELQVITRWISAQGVPIDGLTADAVVELLARDNLPKPVRRVLEIRQTLGLASVKKLGAIQRRLTADGRLHDLFTYCGADRTGRFSGRGPQPQNLPGGGPDVILCNCGHYHGTERVWCPWCAGVEGKLVPWSPDAVESALSVLQTGDIGLVEHYFDDPVALISGSLRGLFTAAPGHDLICSDFSAIEAVVSAELAGEAWRQEVFRTHGKIYEMSASKITGIPFHTFIDHKERTGEHHPMRKKVGKIAELASGFGGGVVAWKRFGASEYIGDDDTIREQVQQWREASPAIVALWHGLESAATLAVQNPGECFAYRGITYGMTQDVLLCRLLSGRTLTYHEPRLIRDTMPWGKEVFRILYMGTDLTGQWVQLDTWGGKLTENVVQAIARDILCHALKNLERAGYRIVLHVHDEACAEVPEGWGSVAEMERIMSTMPPWADGWPIRAAGGWRGKRFRKG